LQDHERIERGDLPVAADIGGGERRGVARGGTAGCERRGVARGGTAGCDLECDRGV